MVTSRSNRIAAVIASGSAVLAPVKVSRATLLITLLVCAITSVSQAAPYWVAWEGDDYPENQGWNRVTNGPTPAERTLSDGIMTMDGLADTQIDDTYRMNRALNPDPGEEFVMEWRLKVNEVVGHPLALFDPGVAVWSDDDWTVSLVFGEDFVLSFHEDVTIPIEPGVFHAIELHSLDMRTYHLRVDDTLVHVGTFWEPTSRQSRVLWGDRARGAGSLASWDYFRFGVVPEPTTLMLLASTVTTVLLRRRPGHA